MNRHFAATPIALLFVLLASVACRDQTGPLRLFPEARHYSFDHFRTMEECVAAQPDPDFWINCSQTATFCPDGRVELMVTDMVHIGTYAIDGRSVALRLPPNPEVPERVRFTLSPDRRMLEEQVSRKQWHLKEDSRLTEWCS